VAGGKPAAGKGGMGLSVTPGPEFARVAAELRAKGEAAVATAVGKRTKEALQPYRKKLQDAVRATPSERGSRGTDAAAKRGGKGLRDMIADAITVSVTTTGKRPGARVQVDYRKVPDGQKGLPAALEGSRRWRKPVFGNTEVWRGQKSHPWWDRTIGSGSEAGQEMRKIPDDIVTDLDRSL